MTEQVSVNIDTLGARGDGIGSLDGMPVYVSGGLPGEKVTIEISERRKNGIYGEIVSIDQPGSERAQPKCHHFGACGGCQLQHFGDATYRQWTKDRAAFALKQHGFEDVTIEDPFITPPASRRRVALKALKTAAGLILGFNAERSHQIVDIVECPVMSPSLAALLEPLRQTLASILAPKALATLHMTETASGVDLLVETQGSLDLAVREALVDFAATQDIAALHWQADGFLDPVVIRREPIMEFAGARVSLPPAAFIQASEIAEQAMVSRVVGAVAGMGRVADLFCGIGTFTFALAHEHQVLAVEGAQTALAALEGGRNGAQSQGVALKQIVTKHRDLFRRPLSPGELKGFEAVVIDPPRAGAQAQMAELAKSDVARIVSVSCNPNTFARDARLLADGGYSLVNVLPVDQFLWSPHLELIGVFTR